MRHLTRVIVAGLAAAVALTASASSDASARARATDEAAAQVDAAPAYEAVDSFYLFRHPWSWSAIDDRTVVIWATPFDPYLVKLAYPSYDLKWVEGIGVTSFGSRVYAKFDSVQVRGFRYPIDEIFKISREEARSLTRRS